jgi:membrane protein
MREFVKIEDLIERVWPARGATPNRGRGKEGGRGREAGRPVEIPALGWKDIFWRVYASLAEDRVLLIAAGATFYLLLALFPFLAAFVSLYGFVADPVTIADHISYLGGVLPTGGIEMIEGQLRALASQQAGALSFGLLFGVGVALWSANGGVKALFEGLNVVYDETENRSFVRLNLVSFGFTLGAILLGMSFLLAVGVVPAVLAFLRLDAWAELLISLGRWPIMLVATGAALALLYRYGPSREPAKFRWLTSGAAFAAVVWIAMSWGFSFYLENFADYNATYGLLGAVIGFMVWTWLSVAIMLLGGELNAEIEHQTAKDSTTGAPEPMGQRGATMADTVGEAADSSSVR